MRKYDIAYVPNGTNNYYPPKPIDELTLEELKKKYIKNCAKANGNVSVCSKCETPCREGRQAIELLAEQVNNIPLYDGMTLLEKAREENRKRKEKKAKVYWPGWYEESLKSGNQIEWLMTNMNITEKQAKRKVAQYKYLHKDCKVEEKKEVNTNLESKLETLIKKQENFKKEMDKYKVLYEEAQKKYEEIKTKADILCSALDILNDV